MFFLVLGIVFTVFAFHYGLVAGDMPGPGLFPFVVGAALVFLSSILFIGHFSYKGDEGKKNGEEETSPPRGNWGKPLLVLIALCGYIVVLKYLGFVATTFLFMLFLLKSVEPQKWRTTFIASILTAALTYALFGLWLKVDMPKGIFGFIGG